jgi:hypothetical protein
MLSLKESLEDTLSTPIDYYFALNLETLSNVVDRLGGVKIDIPYDVRYEDPEQNLHIELSKGEQILDGERALYFVRYRFGYTDGDLGRVDAQKIFMSSFLNKIRNETTLTQAISILRECIRKNETDMPFDHMISLATRVLKDSPEYKIYYMTLPGEATRKNIDSGLSYFVVNKAGAIDLIKNYFNSELIPRNVDVFNFHCYYLWDIYDEFEKDVVQWSLDEPVIPEETRYFLKDEIVSVKEVADAMGADAEAGLKTGLDWPRRISLYVSIDEKKQDELSAFLDSKLKEKNEFFREKMHTGIERGLETHKKTVPDSKIVLGEGATYCASPTLSFERDSESFWNIINEQMVYLREKGYYGSVTSTTHSPNRISAWEPCKERYVLANKIFKGEQ